MRETVACAGRTGGWVEDDTQRGGGGPTCLYACCVRCRRPAPDPSSARTDRDASSSAPRGPRRAAPSFPRSRWGPGTAALRLSRHPLRGLRISEEFSYQPSNARFISFLPLDPMSPSSSSNYHLSTSFCTQGKAHGNLSVRNVVGSLHSISLNLSKNLCTII
jgi:hypothetical protein